MKLLILILLAAPVLTAQTGRWPNARFRGQFGLSEYGFTVTIPDKVIAYGPTCDEHGTCGPMHGINGTLLHDPNTHFFVFPEHWLKFDSEAQEFVMGALREPNASLSIRSIAHQQLDRLDGTRIVATRNSETVDVIFALRRVSENEAILYQIGLATPSTRFAQNKPILDAGPSKQPT